MIRITGRVSLKRRITMELLNGSLFLCVRRKLRNEVKEEEEDVLGESPTRQLRI